MLQRLVRRLASTFILVKACACFAAQHLLVAQPEQDSWDVIALAVGLLEGVADIDRNIDADFIDQSQRTHRHSPFHQRTIDSLRVHAALKQLRGFEQVRKQNAVHQEARAVAHDHG